MNEGPPLTTPLHQLLVVLQKIESRQKQRATRVSNTQIPILIHDSVTNEQLPLPKTYATMNMYIVQTWNEVNMF